MAGLDCKVHIWYCKVIARLTAISLTAIGSYYWVTHFPKIAMQCPFFPNPWIFDVQDSYSSLLISIYCFSVARVSRRGDINLKLCVYSVSEKINFWAVKIFIYFSRYIIDMFFLKNWSASISYFSGMCTVEIIIIITLLVIYPVCCRAVWHNSSMLITSNMASLVNAYKDSLKLNYISMYFFMFCPLTFW